MSFCGKMLWVFLAVAVSAWGATSQRRPTALSLELLCAHDIMIPVTAQTIVKVRPKLKTKNLGGSHLHNVAYLQPSGRRPALIAATNELGLRRLSLKTGNVVQKGPVIHHVKNNGTWSPMIEAVAPDESFFITMGGVSFPVVHTNVHDLRDYQILNRHPFVDGRGPVKGLSLAGRLKKAREDFRQVRQKLRELFVSERAFRRFLKELEDDYNLEPANMHHYSEQIRGMAQVYVDADSAAQGYSEDNFIQATLITPDSQKILTMSDSGETVVWTKTASGRFKAGNPVYLSLPEKWGEYPYLHHNLSSAVISPDGRVLAVGLDNGRIATYSMENILWGNQLNEPMAVNETFFTESGRTADYPWANTALAFSKEGRVLYAAMAKTRDHRGPGPFTIEERLDEVEYTEVAFFDTHSLNKVLGVTREIGSMITDISVSSVGVIVTRASDPSNSIKLWNSATGRMVAEFTVERDPDSRYLSSGNGPQDPFYAHILSPDGRFFVTGTDGGNLSVWNLAKATLVTTVRLGHGLTGLSFSNDGKYLVTGSYGGDGRLFLFEDFLKKGGTNAATMGVFVSGP